MGRKRKSRSNHYSGPASADTTDVGASPSALPPLPRISVSAFTLSSSITSSTRPEFPAADSDDEDSAKPGEWQTAKRHKKAKQSAKHVKGSYPEFVLSPTRLKRKISIADLQGLMLWLLADGVAPQWLLVKVRNSVRRRSGLQDLFRNSNVEQHKPEIRRVVVLMVPGLAFDMLDGTIDLGFRAEPGAKDEATPRDEKELSNISPDDYFPSTLDRRKLPACLGDLAGMFSHVLPVKALGDDRYGKVHSPVLSFLKAPVPKGQEPSVPARDRNRRLVITDLLMSIGELLEDKYFLHSSQYAEQRNLFGVDETDEDRAVLEKRRNEGWVETDLTRSNDTKPEAGSTLSGKTVYALDCEMCDTAAGSELTRISIVSWDGKVVYDTFVKPLNAITDYLTQYSGVTPEHLTDCTTTLTDVQSHLLSIFNSDTILVGQSLVADLTALKLIHPHIIDTSVIYHHTRGPPYKASLKWLASKFLRREIQANTDMGHDSVEDALSCLDLVKLKLEKGLTFGTIDAMTESVFKRLLRQHPSKSSAVVDHGDPATRHGAGATRCVSAASDEDVATAVLRCALGDPCGTLNGVVGSDLVWGRLSQLDNARGWSGPDTPSADERGPEFRQMLATAAVATVANIKRVHDSLPPCSAFIVYSGTGDPRRMRELSKMRQTFRDEYKTKKWDELSVKWTDDEEQALKRAVQETRNGLGLLTVK